MVDSRMPGAVQRLVNEFDLLLCLDCGKCVAVCPMAQIFDDFSREVSPRGVIGRALMGREMLNHVGIWFCLTCDLCTELCPAGVRFRDFVEAVRQLALGAGITAYSAFCRQCDVYLGPQHTVAYLRHKLGEAADLGEGSTKLCRGLGRTAELLTLCPRCRRYDLGRKVIALGPLYGRTTARKTQAVEDR